MAAKRNVDESGSGFWARFAVLTVVVLWVSLIGGNWLGKWLMRSNPTFATTTVEEDYRNMPGQRSRLRGRPPVVTTKETPADSEAGVDEPSPTRPSASPSKAAPSPERVEERPSPTPTRSTASASPAKPRPAPVPTIDVPTEPEKPAEKPSPVTQSNEKTPEPPVPTPERPTQQEKSPSPPVPTPASPGTDE